MNRVRCVGAILITLLVAACTAKRQPGDLTIAELFDRAAELNGRRVAVIGYYVYELENTSLYASPEEWQHEHLLQDGVFGRSIWINPGWRRTSQLTNRYVRAIGTFRYRPEFRRTIEKRDDGREFESILPLGYGHMGLSPSELSDVTLFRPLR
jgi:hypothetical protein